MPHTEHTLQAESAKAKPTKSKARTAKNTTAKNTTAKLAEAGTANSRTHTSHSSTVRIAPEPWRSARYTAGVLKISRETVAFLFEENIIRTAPKGKRRATTDTWIAEYQERMFHINERKTRVQHERLLPPVVIIENDASLPTPSTHTTESR